MKAKKDGSSPMKSMKAEETEVKTVKKTLNYIPFKSAWEADYSRLNRKNWKRIKSHFILTKCKSQFRLNLNSTRSLRDCLSVSPPGLLIFRSQMNRDPEMATRQEDLERLYQIKDHILHDMKLDPQTIDNSAFE